MPVTLTYPGVYIEEVPSGVRTIVGVATSITAFVGRAERGPVDEPVIIGNFGDFERAFGGLGLDYPMSYAVRDFFVNGGSQAVIVRVYAPPDQDGDGDAALVGRALIQLGDDGDALVLAAASPGAWANRLRARVDHDVPLRPGAEGGEDGDGNGDGDGQPAEPNGAGTATEPHPLPWVDAFGLDSDDLFNLTVRDTATGATETFLNLTVVESPRRIDRVLEQESSFVRVPGDRPETRPAAHGDITPETADAVWTDDTLSTPVTTDGTDSADLDQTAYTGDEGGQRGVFALERADLFNLLCIPPDRRGTDIPVGVLSDALTYCERRRAVLLVDPRTTWTDPSNGRAFLDELSLTGLAARNAALYYPNVVEADPLLDGQLETFAPCGVVAGVIARTDATRGVWKAPAGTEAALRGVQALTIKLTDQQNGLLNPLGINSLRSFPIIGRVVWGTRTLRGADQLADEYKYLPVRRLALFIEESLFRGTQWVVFEPNDEPLWAQIRLNVGAFMRNLFRQGAFQGSSPREAYFVKVDKETTTQNDINLGIVNIVVGFAPLKPAEFVVIKIQQIAGQIET